MGIRRAGSRKKSEKLMDLCIPESSTLKEAMQAIDMWGFQSVAVVKKDLTLVGVISDGDIRRALLANASLGSYVKDFMNKTPVCSTENSSDQEAIMLMRKFAVRIVPIVGKDSKVLRILTDQPIGDRKNHSPVLIMAGGRGERLLPITRDIPKPLVKVFGYPVLEILIRQLRSQGFYKIYIAVHYLAEEIANYFGDGNAFDVEIRYLYEETPLGTAGAINLIPDRENEYPLILCNADLIQTINFSEILSFHEHSNSDLTIVGAKYKHQIPYGVLEVQGSKLLRINEKPWHEEIISAGVYVLSQNLRSKFSTRGAFHITEVIERSLSLGQEPSIVIAEGFWLDIGTQETLKAANESPIS